MTTLQSELRRLYLPHPHSGSPTAKQPPDLIDASGGVRALVLELTHPPDWDTLSRVWHGVQDELELPAPAIAVNGVDALQLWFSLAEPVDVAQAHTFLEGLRQRYLGEVPARRVRLRPLPDASPQRQTAHAELVPAPQDATGNWSAFLAPDLVALFSETPWLDMPPSEEGQATLLRSMDMAQPPGFQAACERLLQTPTTRLSTEAVAAGKPVPSASEGREKAFATEDPRQFLLQVMNDTTVALALRIEAAKALLPR